MRGDKRYVRTKKAEHVQTITEGDEYDDGFVPAVFHHIDDFIYDRTTVNNQNSKRRKSYKQLSFEKFHI